MNKIDLPTLEWMDIDRYPYRECELVWRMQFKVANECLVEGSLEENLERFCKDSGASNQIFKEVQLIKRLSRKINLDVQAANSAKDVWCFRFASPMLSEAVYIAGLGEAFEWLRLRYIDLISA